MYTGIYSRGAATTMCAIMFTVVASFACFKTCIPFTKYRLIVFIIAIVLALGGMGLALLSAFYMGGFLFHLDFKAMNPVNYFETLVIIVILVTLYLSTTYIIEVLKGEHLDVNSKSRSKKSSRGK